MRLAVLDHGHSLPTKALFALYWLVTRHRAPDVVKTLKYRSAYFGGAMEDAFQEIMRGPSGWSVGDRELMAAFVSRTNECEF